MRLTFATTLAYTIIMIVIVVAIFYIWPNPTPDPFAPCKRVDPAVTCQP